MILDQSLFFGMADIYDRHRDMRLDVDNMSYEVWLIQTNNQRILPLFLGALFVFLTMSSAGIVGFGRAYWECQHRTK